MKPLERFGHLFEVVCLVGCGIALGATAATVRARSRADRELAACVADVRAHDEFIRLVVDDVERSVSRTAKVLSASGGFMRPGAPTAPPTAYAGGEWWCFDPDAGHWEKIREVAP